MPDITEGTVLWQWSATEIEAFWASLSDYFAIRASAPYTRVLDERTIRGPGLRLPAGDRGARAGDADARARRAAAVARPRARAPDRCGTDARARAIAHGHGGIILEHLKTMAVHLDLRPGDRLCWMTTTGWIMWNLLAGALLGGVTCVLFDGNPGHLDPGTLEEGIADVHAGRAVPRVPRLRAVKSRARRA